MEKHLNITKFFRFILMIFLQKFKYHQQKSTWQVDVKLGWPSIDSHKKRTWNGKWKLRFLVLSNSCVLMIFMNKKTYHSCVSYAICHICKCTAYENSKIQLIFFKPIKLYLIEEYYLWDKLIINFNLALLIKWKILNVVEIY